MKKFLLALIASLVIHVVVLSIIRMDLRCNISKSPSEIKITLSTYQVRPPKTTTKKFHQPALNHSTSKKKKAILKKHPKNIKKTARKHPIHKNLPKHTIKKVRKQISQQKNNQPKLKPKRQPASPLSDKPNSNTNQSSSSPSAKLPSPPPAQPPNSNSNKPQTVSQHQTEIQQKLQEQYLKAVISELEKHKRYPPIARRLGIEGTVTVEFSINKDGKLKYVRIASSSGSSILDSAAKKLVKSCHFPPLPPDFDHDSFKVKIPIHYKLQ